VITDPPLSGAFQRKETEVFDWLTISGLAGELGVIATNAVKDDQLPSPNSLIAATRKK
jgi:hypothetical protein